MTPCQRCPDEASVHLTETVNGQIREVHLCGVCAKKAGFALPSAPPDLGLDFVVNALITAHVGELVGDLAQRSCPDCGVKFMEFRALGMLGCPADYDAFRPGLLPLLRRTHGATRHVGKVPRRGASTLERLRLRSRLREAIIREEYEEAARLRDRLRQKEGPQQ
jgi:protein arginine kinase activator